MTLPEAASNPVDELPPGNLNRNPLGIASPVERTTDSQNRLLQAWEALTRAGLAEPVLKLGTDLLLLVLVLGIIWAVPQLYAYYVISPDSNPALAASLPTPTPIPMPPQLPNYETGQAFNSGIPRLNLLHTNLPSRSRFEVTQYTVQAGDTLFGIAEKFSLRPETILWANQYTLGDNPHNLLPDQVLNILPVDGTYHKWQTGDGLNGVADFFGVRPEDIVNWPGNKLDSTTIGDYAHPNIPPGTWLVVPGGKRAFVTWSAPEIPRDNPGVAKVLGPGACEAVADGAIGVGLFIWPANNHFLSGFDYTPEANHSGIDIDGNEGDPVYVVDNGVVVYAGWNDWGYGNTIVVNHGNGWQTLYAHLSSISVGCGQSVWQGNLIGAIGSTGRSSGSHLHFEMMYSGTKVNPWNYLP